MVHCSWVVIAFSLIRPAALMGQEAPILPSVVPYASLTTGQRAVIERGGSVQILETLPTSPWPRSTVYEFVDATPEECAAVLSDYELQATYLPQVKTSRTVRRLSAIETDVEYVIDIPIYPDERSVSRQQLSVAGGVYAIRWHTLISDSLPHGSLTAGRAWFSAMMNPRSGAQGTVMIHYQLVVPNSIFARIPYVRNKAIGASKDIARAIVRQVELERKSDPRLLERQMTRLRQALASRPDSGQLH